MDKIAVIIRRNFDDDSFYIQEAGKDDIRVVLISKDKLEEYKKIQKAYDKMQDELGNLSNYYSGN